MKMHNYKVFRNMLGSRMACGRHEIPADLEEATLTIMKYINQEDFNKDTVERIAASFLNVIYDKQWKSYFSFTHTPPAWWNKKFTDPSWNYPKELYDTGLVDHPFWLKDKKTGDKTLLLQPYGSSYCISSYTIGKLNEFCEKNGLCYAINAQSPHYASKTINIFISRKKEVKQNGM